ncbi:MAG: metalloregulator ArsR/SmtB family transcription factor [Thalassolituus sp.]
MTPVCLMKLLADETRLSATVLLLSGPKCVCDLTEALGVSQPKLSRHLAILRDAELVTTEKKGQWVYYSLTPSLPQWAISIIQTLQAPSQEASGIHPQYFTGESSGCC